MDLLSWDVLIHSISPFERCLSFIMKPKWTFTPWTDWRWPRWRMTRRWSSWGASRATSSRWLIELLMDCYFECFFFIFSSWPQIACFVGVFFQCFGSGSVWIRFISVSRIRIRFNKTDPDPGSKKSAKIMVNFIKNIRISYIFFKII